MHHTVDAIVEPDGTVRLLEPFEGRTSRRALVTFLDESEEGAVPPVLIDEDALMDWTRPEEDEAWRDLQPAP